MPSSAPPALDQTGQPIAEGDSVLVPCIILKLLQVTPDLCVATLETEAAFGPNLPTLFTLQPGQFRKVPPDAMPSKSDG